MAQGKLLGTIKWFDATKGYGFIAEDGGNDVFVHISALRGTGLTELKQDDRVCYDMGTNPRTQRMCAVNLSRL